MISDAEVFFCTCFKSDYGWGKDDPLVKGDIAMCSACCGLGLIYPDVDFYAAIERINDLRLSLQQEPYKMFNLKTPAAILLERIFQLQAEIIRLYQTYGNPELFCFAGEIANGALGQMIDLLQVENIKELVELAATKNMFTGERGQRLYQALFLASTGNSDLAEQQMLQLAAEFPNSSKLANHIAWFYLVFRKNPAEAMNWYCLAFENSPCAEYSYRIGVCLVALGDYQTALHFFEQSKSFDDYGAVAPHNQHLLGSVSLQFSTAVPA